MINQTLPLPAPIPGELEPGLQVDMFGVQHRFTPHGRGRVTQISMDDQLRLATLKGELANVTPWTDYESQEVNIALQKDIIEIQLANNIGLETWVPTEKEAKQ